MQAGASIRMKHSGLNVGHTWHHAQPLENASQFQISIPTQLGCLPMTMGLPPKVPTCSIHYPSFRPQSQDTIHTYCTRIESPGLRNDTHTRETPHQDRNPCPTAPTTEPKQAGTRPPQNGCPKQRHGFVLAKRPHPRAPCTANFSFCYAQP